MFGVILSRLYNKAHCNSNNETPLYSSFPPQTRLLSHQQPNYIHATSKRMLWTIFIIIIMIHLK